jgi:hypothetical protein
MSTHNNHTAVCVDLSYYLVFSDFPEGMGIKAIDIGDIARAQQIP